jgi:hypothetical protein
MPRLHARPCFVVLVLLAGGTEARAGLRFEQTTVRVGEVRSGAALAEEFRFRNDGPGDVELLEARPSCGCLRPTLSRRLLHPGDAGAVRLEVNTLTQAAGPHAWQLHLRYRQGDAVEEEILQVAASVVPELTVQPAALTLFTDRALSQEVVLTDLRARPLEGIELRTSAAGLRASLMERARDAVGHPVFRIRLDVAADYPEGRYEEALDIYTGDPLYRHLQVPVTVVRQPHQRLAALPAEVTVRAAPGQPVPSQLVRVRDARGEPVVVEAVTADDPAVQCRWASGPDNFATVRVQIDGARLGGTGLQTAVHIRTSAPVPETITVPVGCAVE